MSKKWKTRSRSRSSGKRKSQVWLSLSLSLSHKWRIIPEIAPLGKFCGFTFYLPGLWACWEFGSLPRRRSRQRFFCGLLRPLARSLFSLSLARSLSAPPSRTRTLAGECEQAGKPKESSPAHSHPLPTITPHPNIILDAVYEPGTRISRAEIATILDL